MGWKTKTTPKNKRQQHANQKKSDSSEPLTFIEHVYELRSRLFWVIATLLVASAIGFQFKDILVNFIMAPLHGEKLVYLTPGGGFSFIFTLCLYFGALLTIPIVVYHLYRFLQPIMGQASRRLLTALLFLSTFLAMGGAAFGYLVAIPAAINFLTGFAGEAVTANLTAESYLSFVMAYMFGLAALFQLPLILFMVDHIRRFPPGTLLSMQRFVVVGAVIAAAIITPTPDIVNQMIIAGPIVVVYQLGVLAVYVRRRREATETKLQTTPAPIEALPDDLVAEQRPLPAVQPPLIAPEPAKVVHQSQRLHPQRSIDGFTRASPQLVPPPRPTQPTRSIISQSPRRLRSIDGFSIV